MKQISQNIIVYWGMCTFGHEYILYILLYIAHTTVTDNYHSLAYVKYIPKMLKFHHLFCSIIN